MVNTDRVERLLRKLNGGSNPLGEQILRGRAEVAQRAHNPKVAGSNPAPATKMIVLVQGSTAHR